MLCLCVVFGLFIHFRSLPPPTHVRHLSASAFETLYHPLLREYIAEMRKLERVSEVVRRAAQRWHHVKLVMVMDKCVGSPRCGCRVPWMGRTFCVCFRPRMATLSLTAPWWHGGCHLHPHLVVGCAVVDRWTFNTKARRLCRWRLARVNELCRKSMKAKGLLRWRWLIVADAAATCLQSFRRGVVGRRFAREHRRQMLASVLLNSQFRRYLGLCWMARTQERRRKAATDIQVRCLCVLFCFVLFFWAADLDMVPRVLEGGTHMHCLHAFCCHGVLCVVLVARTHAAAWMVHCPVSVGHARSLCAWCVWGVAHRQRSWRGRLGRIEGRRALAKYYRRELAKVRIEQRRHERRVKNMAACAIQSIVRGVQGRAKATKRREQVEAEKAMEQEIHDWHREEERKERLDAEKVGRVPHTSRRCAVAALGCVLVRSTSMTRVSAWCVVCGRVCGVWRLDCVQTRLAEKAEEERKERAKADKRQAQRVNALAMRRKIQRSREAIKAKRAATTAKAKEKLAAIKAKCVCFVCACVLGCVCVSVYRCCERLWCKFRGTLTMRAWGHQIQSLAGRSQGGCAQAFALSHSNDIQRGHEHRVEVVQLRCVQAALHKSY